MPDTHEEEPLASTSDHVVLLRLAVDCRHAVHHGEVVDADSWRSHPFRGLDGVTAAIEEWITTTIGPPQARGSAEAGRDCPSAIAARSTKPEDPCRST